MRRGALAVYGLVPVGYCFVRTNELEANACPNP